MLRQTKSKGKLVPSQNLILASGSMVVRKKMGKDDNDLLGSQSLRKIGSEIAILQHTGEDFIKRIEKKGEILHLIGCFTTLVCVV